MGLFQIKAIHLGRLAVGAFAAALLMLAPTAPAAPVPGDPCPNGDIRQAQGMAHLPDCRALEMVSPPAKFNQFANGPAISLDGSRVRFTGLAALAETPGLLEAAGDPYVATRGPVGWTTQPTSPPAGMISIATFLSRAYAPDYSRWLHVTATAEEQDLGRGGVYSAGLGGMHEPLSPPLQAANPLIGEPSAIALSILQGASADLSHFYFLPGRRSAANDAPITTSFLPDDPTPEGPRARRNAYIAQLDFAGSPTLELLVRDEVGEEEVWGGNCGARVGGDAAPFDMTLNEPNYALRNQGAIARDGSHVYLTTRPSQGEVGPCDPGANMLRIMRRVETAAGPDITQLLATECSAIPVACVATGGGDDIYQGTSVDGSKVYFLTSRPLAETDVDIENTGCKATIGESAGCDLYLYDEARQAGERLIQVSAGETGAGARVLASSATVSGDGSRVYFIAQGVLTDDESPAGEEADAGEPNLYLWNAASETTSFIGTLDPGDAGVLWGNVSAGAYAVPQLGRDNSGVEIGGNGHVLLFQSNAPLTADDLEITRQRDIFLYDAQTDQLERVSKAAPGGADNENFDAGASIGISRGPDFAVAGRRISEDGKTIVFRTAEGLLPADTDGNTDSYLWREGQLHSLPGTEDPDGRLADVPTVSADGSTVAFTSYSQLLSFDGDTTIDVYVARVGGGFPIISKEICQLGEAVPSPAHCQGDRVAPPDQAAVQTAIPRLGNPKGLCRKLRCCPRGTRRARAKTKAKGGRKLRCVKKAKHERKRASHNRKRGRK